jgi:phthiocerol/phenolphthiocerol synthesis type-I polyketide synthase E
MLGPDTQTHESEPASRSAIAVIGMAGRFPGARGVKELWTNLRAGVESIHAFTDEALLAAGESPDRLRDPSYIKACGRLDDIDRFDAGFFGLSPRDAAVFDPQHRLFLECAWEAFEDAGYVGERVAGPVGVFACSGASEYLMSNVIRNRGVMDSMGAWLVRHTGNDPSFLATRVSYELNLRGPSMSVQTACSSSLVAVHVACQSLLDFECDMALAGGATVYPEQDRGYFHRAGEILSPDGHCRAFDAGAGGTVMASAVGCVILKRLDDALRDRDHVLAVVLGSAINNDGSDKVGYLAPSVGGQARVVREALAVAGVSAEEVSYVEAHGTGTLIGDPIEVTALTEAFRATTDREQFCAIGSLKTNIGHAGEAAGVCGLIKTVLALAHREIPASLHYRSPNPQIDFVGSPFFVNEGLREWAAPSGKRRIAGVTALGAGGTNAHVLVQEAPVLAAAAVDTGVESQRSGARARGRDPHLLVLSARTPGALDRASQNLAAHLRAHPDLDLADVAYTLLSGRRAFAFRRAVVARDASDAADALDRNDGKRVMTCLAKAEAPRVVFMFPGGGAQYGGMGAELYARERVYREAIDECLSGLDEPLSATLRALLLAGPSESAAASERLESPGLTLPALFPTEYAVARLLESWGIAPGAMIGHSAGEYAAACLAGVLSPRHAMALVTLRGRLFESLPEGSMLSLALPEPETRALLGDDLSLAAVNGPSSCVVAGPAESIARLEATLRAREIGAARVPFRVAAHSSVVEPILGEFEQFVRTLPLRPPRTPFVSNRTGTWITDDEATDPAYWTRHLREPVRFSRGIQEILEAPNQVLVEVGPGRTLAGFARQQSRQPVAMATTLRRPQRSESDLSFMKAALGRLWVSGVALDEAKLFDGKAPRRVPLPTYPFERQRYWVDPDPEAGMIVSPRDASSRRVGSAVDLAPEARAAESAAPLRGGPLFGRPELNATFVAPRDALERELAAMWRELLGVAKVGVHDDFFELGGQSLVAVRMFQRIAKKYGVELPLSTLFEASTIGDWAALLRPHLDLAEPERGVVAKVTPIESVESVEGKVRRPFSPLVTIQAGKGWPPLFCVHGAGGNVLNLVDMARAMGSAQPFYGLQAYGVDGVTPPHETIEQMASAYLPKVRELQPEGPYLLGGYSGGGLVAFEMAQRLHAAGQEVKLLALIDTFHPEIPVRAVTMRARVSRLREEKLRYVAEALARRRDRLREPINQRAIDEHRARREPVPFALREFHLTRNFDAAAWRYRPRPWPGRAILFQAEQVAYIYRDAGPYYGWERHVLGGIEVVPVPGDHATVVLGRSAEVLVRSLGAAIARTQEPSSWTHEDARSLA